MSLEPFIHSDDPKQVYKLPGEQERIRTKKEQVLMLLLDGEWHTSDELKRITHRFSARLYDLRREGWLIERKYLGDGIWAFRLVGRGEKW